MHSNAAFNFYRIQHAVHKIVTLTELRVLYKSSLEVVELDGTRVPSEDCRSFISMLLLFSWPSTIMSTLKCSNNTASIYRGFFTNSLCNVSNSQHIETVKIGLKFSLPFVDYCKSNEYFHSTQMF
jgi:hypothetical protein